MTSLRRPIRLGFVLHAMQVAGAEVLVKAIMRRLGDKIVPAIFCLDESGRLGDELRNDGYPVIVLGRRPGMDFRVAWRLAREFRRRRLEIVHAHQYTPFFYSALARLCWPPGPRLIFTEHGRHFPDVVSPRRRAANRLVLDRLADAVNAVSLFSARRVARLDGFAGAQIEVIENGIDLERFGQPVDRLTLRAQLGLDPCRTYIVNVARFHPVKDQATLLRAFREVVAQRSDVDLLLVGDGALRRNLEELARDLGIQEQTRFLGVRSDVVEILQAVDLFVLTSVSEAAPLTLLEAMASRLPVVVTNVGGIGEMVRDGIEAFLVPAGDASAIAAGLLEALRDPDRARAMGAAGAARVQETYRIEQTLDRYYELYRRLAGRA